MGTKLGLTEKTQFNGGGGGGKTRKKKYLPFKEDLGFNQTGQKKTSMKTKGLEQGGISRKKNKKEKPKEKE